MPCYRFSSKIISRSNGGRAVASAAYRSGTRLVDQRYGGMRDYRGRYGVLFSEVLAPDHVPATLRNRETLWNTVEASEKRCDSQLAREIQLNLPHELDHAARVEMVREFVMKEFVSNGMIADIAIHAPDPKGDARNHHAHIMLTMRPVEADGRFGGKGPMRHLNAKATLANWRKAWADHHNRVMGRNGFVGERYLVDHRSYEARGIDREAQPKQGPMATQMLYEGRDSNAARDRRAAIERNNKRSLLEQAQAYLEARIEEARAKLEARSANENRPGQPGPQERAIARRFREKARSEFRQLRTNQKAADTEEARQLDWLQAEERRQLQERHKHRKQVMERRIAAIEKRQFSGLRGIVRQGYGFLRGLVDPERPDDRDTFRMRAGRAHELREEREADERTTLKQAHADQRTAHDDTRHQQRNTERLMLKAKLRRERTREISTVQGEGDSARKPEPQIGPEEQAVLAEWQQRRDEAVRALAADRAADRGGRPPTPEETEADDVARFRLESQLEDELAEEVRHARNRDRYARMSPDARAKLKRLQQIDEDLWREQLEQEERQRERDRGHDRGQSR